MSKKEIPFNRILIVDDSEVDLFIAHSLLKRHKPSICIYHAKSVDCALDMIKGFSLAEMPDLVILDLHFERQEKQGKDFLKEFRTLFPGQSASAKIIALTAFSTFSDVNNFVKNFSHIPVLKKPFAVEMLMGIHSK